MNLERAAFPKINVQDAAKLPIYHIDFTTTAVEREAQLDKGVQFYRQALTHCDMQNAIDFVEAEKGAGRTDVVHDLLAFLATRMMEMNREKRTNAKQFLTDLKDFHGIDAHALNPKTKLNEFWKLEAVDLFAHLRKNSRRLEERKVNLSKDTEDKIRSRFVTAKETLLPLEAQIAFTDQLIDQLVYRLYGLTPEQIQIVEDATK
jgi:hypothetical protein